jgi:hypothetical protein
MKMVIIQHTHSGTTFYHTHNFTIFRHSLSLKVIVLGEKNINVLFFVYTTNQLLTLLISKSLRNKYFVYIFCV